VGGRPRVVLDILLFEHFTAEESLAQTGRVVEKLRTSAEVHKNWERFYQPFVTEVFPRLRARARELRGQQAAIVPPRDGRGREC
jgi:hypothetical protein